MEHYKSLLFYLLKKLERVLEGKRDGCHDSSPIRGHPPEVHVLEAWFPCGDAET